MTSTHSYHLAHYSTLRCRVRKTVWPHLSFCSWNYFGSVYAEKKRQIPKQLLRVWWKGMQVVLLEYLSLSHDQWAHHEPLFLIRKSRIHNTICLKVPHTARGPYPHLPCWRGSCHAQLSPGTQYHLALCGNSFCIKMLTWRSWRQHG